MTRRSSSPSGLRVCTSSYVFDLSLSLSRVLEVVQYWCITRFAIIVGSYDVSPPLLPCNGFSFPFEVILSDWAFKDLRTLDVLICGDNGIFTWSTWWMFWWSTCDFRDLVNLCIGVSTRFLLWLSGRNFGALFEVLCVGWIDESEIVWCISYNHVTSQISNLECYT